MGLNRKQELRNIIKRVEDELRVKRIKVFIGTLLVYSAISFFWVFMDEDFLTRIVLSLFMGGIIYYVSLILWSIGYVHLYELNKSLKELEKEYYNIEE